MDLHSIAMETLNILIIVFAVYLIIAIIATLVKDLIKKFGKSEEEYNSFQKELENIFLSEFENALKETKEEMKNDKETKDE